jgi:cofilin
MIYASSKDALRKGLQGIGAELQGTEYAEVAYETGMSLFSSSFVEILISSHE